MAHGDGLVVDIFANHTHALRVVQYVVGEFEVEGRLLPALVVDAVYRNPRAPDAFLGDVHVLQCVACTSWSREHEGPLHTGACRY